MSEELTSEQYQQKIAELEKKLQEATNGYNKFDELKQKYEEIIENKNQEINELKTEVDNTKKNVDDTVGKLNDEIQARLDANEEYQKALNTIKELEQTKAETTVDTYIAKGVLLPAQRETALKLCLNDPDTFSDLYRDAKPVVETTHKRRSLSTGTAERIANYLKN